MVLNLNNWNWPESDVNNVNVAGVFSSLFISEDYARIAKWARVRETQCENTQFKNDVYSKDGVTLLPINNGRKTGVVPSLGVKTSDPVFR